MHQIIKIYVSDSDFVETHNISVLFKACATKELIQFDTTETTVLLF
jgi:hypothetical protein